MSSIINKVKHDNKVYSCPFRCGTCDLLGDHVKTKYEIVCILAENDKAVFSPFGREVVK